MSMVALPLLLSLLLPFVQSHSPSSSTSSVSAASLSAPSPDGHRALSHPVSSFPSAAVGDEVNNIVDRPPLTLKAARRTIHRPPAHKRGRFPHSPRWEPLASGLLVQSPPPSLFYDNNDEDPSWEWEEAEMIVPDLTDKMTVMNLATIANDAYARPEEKRWRPVDEFGLVMDFGWDEAVEGAFRGHVFANGDNSTIIVSIKGTSWDGLGTPAPGSTARLDRVNDNRLASCCCGHLAPTSPNVCTCFKGSRLNREKKVCDQTCVEMSMFAEDSYYVAGVALMAQVLAQYPSANIWLTGHSLGGVLASLLGLTFGLPAVTFEAFPDRLAVERLRLRVPRKRENNPVTHVFHTGDMIAVGKCRGALGFCGRGGYAMESQCKQGNLIVYETVEKWGWTVDYSGRSHFIRWVIDNVYSKDWNNGEIEGPEGRGRDWTDVPRVTGEREDCVDCADWKFV